MNVYCINNSLQKLKIKYFALCVYINMYKHIHRYVYYSNNVKNARTILHLMQSIIVHFIGRHCTANGYGVATLDGDAEPLAKKRVLPAVPSRK